jgi:hypothetical protein
MLESTIEEFDDQQWITGFSILQVPVKLAIHILDTLDYYFCGKPSDQYTWGHRFGGGWWELKDDQLPSKTAVLDYAREIAQRIFSELRAKQDSDLFHPFEIDDSGATLLGHYVYALRHTMHHQGQLSCLSIQQGNEGGDWA